MVKRVKKRGCGYTRSEHDAKQSNKTFRNTF